MKITLTKDSLRPTKPTRRLPGEPRDFTPKKSPTTNLVPPQHLAADGTITSTRPQEVTTTQDPLIAKLRTERTNLLTIADRLLVLASKHCPADHHDWTELVDLAGSLDRITQP